jgi:sugar lactone lactonase YvrE
VNFRTLNDHRCQLGESPVWDAQHQALWWVDIPGRELLRWSETSFRRWPLDAETGCLALHADGFPRLARRDGLFRFDPATGRCTQLAEPPYDPARQRFNDGKVAPDGSWWIGAMSDAREPEAALYRWDGARFEVKAEGACVSNGLAWSPDGGTMYWSDTKVHTVYRFASGAREVFAQWQPRDPTQPIDQYAGRPDGAAVDAEGGYWSAMFEGQRLLRLSPQGELLQTLMLPVRCATMPCFGGPDLKTLFITTASHGRPADELAAQPLAGALLTLRVEVSGVPVPLLAV